MARDAVRGARFSFSPLLADALALLPRLDAAERARRPSLPQARFAAKLRHVYVYQIEQLREEKVDKTRIWWSGHVIIRFVRRLVEHQWHVRNKHALLVLIVKFNPHVVRWRRRRLERAGHRVLDFLHAVELSSLGFKHALARFMTGVAVIQRSFTAFITCTAARIAALDRQWRRLEKQQLAARKSATEANVPTQLRLEAKQRTMHFYTASRDERERAVRAILVAARRAFCRRELARAVARRARFADAHSILGEGASVMHSARNASDAVARAHKRARAAGKAMPRRRVRAFFAAFTTTKERINEQIRAVDADHRARCSLTNPREDHFLMHRAEELCTRPKVAARVVQLCTHVVAHQRFRHAQRSKGGELEGRGAVGPAQVKSA